MTLKSTTFHHASRSEAKGLRSLLLLLEIAQCGVVAEHTALIAAVSVEVSSPACWCP